MQKRKGLEARVLALRREMPFTAVARPLGLFWHWMRAVCARYAELALADVDLSEDCRRRNLGGRGHSYLTLVAEMTARRVIFVTQNHNSD